MEQVETVQPEVSKVETKVKPTVAKHPSYAVIPDAITAQGLDGDIPIAHVVASKDAKIKDFVDDLMNVRGIKDQVLVACLEAGLFYRYSHIARKHALGGEDKPSIEECNKKQQEILAGNDKKLKAELQRKTNLTDYIEFLQNLIRQDRKAQGKGLLLSKEDGKVRHQAFLEKAKALRENRKTIEIPLDIIIS